MREDNLYGWVFTYNTIAGVWGAAKREHYNDLFNVWGSKNILKSKEINTLIDIILRTKGDKTKIDKLVSKSEIY